MRKELTDAMITEMLTNSGHFAAVMGILFMIAAVTVFVLSKKKPDLLGSCTKLFIFFALAGVFMIFKAMTSRDTATEFYVVECEITDMYSTKRVKNNKKKYWINCEDTYKIRISRSDYYNEYEIGDTVYVIVRGDDISDSIHYYSAEEYEYVGDRLLE